MTDSYRRVDLDTDGWRATDIVVLNSFFERLLGIRPIASGAVLFRARSIHTFGLRADTILVELDESGLILRVRRITKNRLVRCSGTWVLELTPKVTAPRVGSALRVMASSPHARDSCDLCHTNRQPR